MRIFKLIMANKMVSLIIVLSLCGLTLLSIATVKFVKIVENNETMQSTTESTSNQTTETATESTTQSTTTTTEITTTTTTTTTKAPDPEINSSNVKIIFQPLIYHYTSLEQGSHIAVGIDYNKNYYDELVEIVCEQTDWTEMGIISIYKFKNVKSVAEVKRIYKKYLSLDIVNQAKLENSNLFSYNNELYLIEGAKGSFDYDASSITYKGKKDGGYVVAIDQFLGNGAYIGTESFLVKYIDGRFKIVKKLGEEQLHPTEYYSPNYDSVVHACFITE